MAERRRIRVTGTVQGVGFRPFVYRQAVALALAGYVRNDSAGVLIEVEGASEQVDELCRRLVSDAPPLARVERVEVTAMSATDQAAFSIVLTDADGRPDSPVSADSATCPACLADVDDPGNRRYRYPFTNCTDCGPRYTIVRAIPYDRPATTMAAFPMCADCRREYDDPADRRFHAQPNACPRCGPALRLTIGGGSPTHGDAALDAAVAALDAGAVLAVKGLGGYHLAVDAGNDAAVATLRARKHRDDKPFAVMAPGMDAARRLVTLDGSGVAALTSWRRPIVLAPRVDGACVSPLIAGDLPELGVMLPYTALHHLLLAGLGRPLVLTSGNLSDEPIAHIDGDAAARLGPIADGILAHDRPIHIRCDDTVVRSGPAGTQMLRRSRGWAPEPISLPFDGRREVLAVGAELKNTAAVARGRAVIASQHIGDLEHLGAYQAFVQATGHLCRLHGIEPDVVAHDLHPEYLSTKYALDLDVPAIGIQHHHAHVASCLVDHGRVDRVLGLAFDGHGWGGDGTLWGGEFLVADLDGFVRVGHLRDIALPGGSAAIREPWRMAVAWVREAAGDDAARDAGARFDPRAADVVALLGAAASIRTTSMGRLFDAVAALVCGRGQVTYEGQAAVELEALARTVPIGAARRIDVDIRRDPAGALVVDPSALVAAVVERVRSPAEAAADFHESIGAAAADAACTLAGDHGVGTVVLTGGVFQNSRLTGIVRSRLTTSGLEVLTHRTIPPNDGGISVGQAAIASHVPRVENPTIAVAAWCDEDRGVDRIGPRAT